ncbi:hypothetical protein Psuf_018130 [Phytohabitans suffuscus]|uniref:Uncharacterized protein n=1 Tax=Phytohabitans suffuscus TaxID=624315 RepID=A0A6F8YEL1_9ACTN|nr:hypothetical protein [Phytohabitans suffuscus]BCB84500.1 hypothetical protein Psuf_018130 [Phytohabitans suffuscus]
MLGSLATVGLVGAAFVGTIGWRVMQEKDASLQTPVEVAGLRLDESARAQETADYLRTAIGARIDLDQSIGVVYADPASANRSVLLFGGTTLIWTPEAISTRSSSCSPTTPARSTTCTRWTPAASAA